jgi:adenosylcobinamide-GDP ribazoletransferase
MRKALAFLTPFGKSAVPSPASLAWFPVVGCAVGLGVGAVWWLAAKAWSAPAAAAVAVAADVALTGYLHLDGLADSADGLLPPLERERRLQAMADPAIGAFGVVSVLVVLLSRFGAFASARPAPLVVAALWCASRSVMAVTIRTVPYARDGGLASAFIENGPRQAPDDASSFSHRRSHGGGGIGRDGTLVAVFSLALVLSLAWVGRGVHGVVAAVCGVVGAVAVVIFARRRIGGFTGDVLGAAGVAGETVGLLVLAARW